VAPDVQEHAKLFRGLFKSAPDAVVIVDERGQIVLANEQTEKLFGFSREELLGQAIEILLPYGLRDRHRQHRADYMTSPHSRPMGVGLELYALHKDGREIPVEISLSPLKTSQGLLISSDIRDISERKRAEGRLRRFARQQEVIAELGMYALEVTDLQTLLDEVSRRMCEALEVDFCKVLELQPGGETLLLKAGSGWREGSVGQVTLGTGSKSLAGYALQSGRPVIAEDLTAETRFEVPSLLQEHGVMSSMMVIILGNGAPYGLLGVDSLQKSTFSQDDVHTLQAAAGLLSHWIHRKQAEDALRDSEARYRGVVEQATVGIAQTDLEGRFTFVNDRYCAIVGRTREELLGGLRMQDITAEEDLPRNMVQFQRMIEYGTGFSIEKRYMRPDGSRIWIKNEVSLVYGANGHPFYAQAITQDITERRQAEEALRELNETLEARVEKRTQALRESEARFATAFHASPTPTIILDLDSLRFLDVNESFLKLLGYERDDIVKHSLYELKLLLESEKRRPAIAQLRAGQPLATMEVSLRTRAGGLRTVLSRIYDKLNVPSRAEVIIWARQRGMVELE
jgi:two-component system, sensor histidine kinase and response regulator